MTSAATIAALPVRQQEVLSAIAVNQDTGHPARTLKALVDKGLIVATDHILFGRPPVTVTRYVVPINVHMAWAEWCAQQPDDEGETP